MSSALPLSDRGRSAAARANRAVYWFSRRWLLVFNLVIGLYVGLPWLAPIFMQIGWTGPANLIYLIYSTQCHQLPQRSFFLFGEKPMYLLAEVQAAWQDTNNPIILRQFNGNAILGWKVAWSDRMVSMYTSLFAGGLLFALLRRWLKPLPLWGFIVLALPMALDGGTHLLSDLAGIGQGFRDSNTWLIVLTGGALPAEFYAGDSLGSFNSWMRLVTGVLFGLGAVWLAYPHLEMVFANITDQIGAKFRRASIKV